MFDIRFMYRYNRSILSYYFQLRYSFQERMTSVIDTRNLLVSLGMTLHICGSLMSAIETDLSNYVVNHLIALIVCTISLHLTLFVSVHYCPINYPNIRWASRQNKCCHGSGRDEECNKLVWGNATWVAWQITCNQDCMSICHMYHPRQSHGISLLHTLIEICITSEPAHNKLKRGTVQNRFDIIGPIILYKAVDANLLLCTLYLHGQVKLNISWTTETCTDLKENLRWLTFS